MNGNAEFTEAAHMMPNHALLLPFAKWRQLPVVKGLVCFEHLIEEY